MFTRFWKRFGSEPESAVGQLNPGSAGLSGKSPQILF
jgi:hypothetical protein